MHIPHQRVAATSDCVNSLLCLIAKQIARRIRTCNLIDANINYGRAGFDKVAADEAECLSQISAQQL